MKQNSDEVKRLARAVVPDGHERNPPPFLTARERVNWPDFLRVVDAIDATLVPTDLPIVVKLQQTLAWLHLIEQSRFDKLNGARISEFLDIIRQAAAEEIPLAQTAESPTPIARMQFRMLTAQYARKDTAADLSTGWRGRWRLFRAATKFARGIGNVPPLQSVFREVPFESLEQSFGLPAECEELWTRYFRVKVQGLHFCGPAYYGIPLVEGFQSLVLIFAATMWIARWLAVSRNDTQLRPEDVSQALAISDHHHGYSPIFGSFGFRRRVRMLAQMGEIPKLIRWYAS